MIGQARITASPLALAGIAATVAEGRWRAPRLLASDPREAGEPLPEADTLRQLMRQVVTDGSGFGRTDKVEMLAPYPAVLAAIKVCWEGDDPGKNCGVCEKCVMTRLNFLAAGIRNAPCFDTPLTPELIANLRNAAAFTVFTVTERQQCVIGRPSQQ